MALNSAAIVICLLLSLISSVSCQDVPLEDCGPGSARRVSVTPCNSDPCILMLNNSIEFAFDFISPVDTPSVNEVIKGLVRGKELPFPEKPRDPCNGWLTPGCPLVKGQLYKFKASFIIPIKMKYALTSDKNEPVVCVSIGAKIMDPNPKPKGRRRKG